MSKLKIAIIGGVAGGASAAARLRRLNLDYDITIYEKNGYVSYANCGLPYYIGDVINERENLILQTPEILKNRFNINVKTKHEVKKIDPESKIIYATKLDTGEEFIESYDKLIISTGSSPLIPNIEGINSDNIFKLWSIEDTDLIKNFCKKNKPKNAVIIGAGFIGMEMAENFHNLGIEVHIVEMQENLLPLFDYEIGSILNRHVSEKNIHLHLGNKVESFEKKDNATIVKLDKDDDINADIVILSIGVKPNSEFVINTGIKVNSSGGIVVNERLETSLNDIYAVGDVVQIKNGITKKDSMIPLAGPANKMGRTVADIISGKRNTYDGTIGTSITKVFDLSAAITGMSEKQLIKEGYVKNKDFFTAIVNQKSHADYYPGATPLLMKMMFSKKGEILGSQVIGRNSVDKTIDIISTVINTKGTIYDLKNLELAYAPPFSSAKAPVNMLGFVAENILSGLVKFTEVKKFVEDLNNNSFESNTIILDVTEDIEREDFRVKNSIHIPMTQIHSRLHEIDKYKDSRIIIYCAIGVRSYSASRFLNEKGFKNVEVLPAGTQLLKFML